MVFSMWTLIVVLAAVAAQNYICMYSPTLIIAAALLLSWTLRFIYSAALYPTFFTPLKHIPTPKVSSPPNISISLAMTNKLIPAGTIVDIRQHPRPRAQVPHGAGARLGQDGAAQRADPVLCDWQPGASACGLDKCNCRPAGPQELRLCASGDLGHDAGHGDGRGLAGC